MDKNNEMDHSELRRHVLGFMEDSMDELEQLAAAEAAAEKAAKHSQEVRIVTPFNGEGNVPCDDLSDADMARKRTHVYDNWTYRYFLGERIDSRRTAPVNSDAPSHQSVSSRRTESTRSFVNAEANEPEQYETLVNTEPPLAPLFDYLASSAILRLNAVKVKPIGSSRYLFLQALWDPSTLDSVRMDERRAVTKLIQPMSKSQRVSTSVTDDLHDVVEIECSSVACISYGLRELASLVEKLPGQIVGIDAMGGDPNQVGSSRILMRVRSPQGVNLAEVEKAIEDLPSIRSRPSVCLDDGGVSTVTF